jgi:hypothetical protein
MSADDKIAEALARIEHKLDVLFVLLESDGAAPHIRREMRQDIRQVGDPRHRCSICKSQVEYFADPIDSVVVRKCGCKTGKIAIDVKAFAPPASPVPSKENSSGEQQQVEDRRNPNPRGGPVRR